MKSDVVAGLNALILYRLGDSPGALAQLRSMVYDTPHFITWRPFAEQSRARYLHATLEFEMGDIERAKGIYHGFLESWSPFDAVYIPHVYIQLGQIAERQSRVEDAISYYRQVMYMWRDCDAEVVPERDEIARRIDSLTLEATTDRG